MRKRGEVKIGSEGKETEREKNRERNTGRKREGERTKRGESKEGGREGPIKEAREVIRKAERGGCACRGCICRRGRTRQLVVAGQLGGGQKETARERRGFPSPDTYPLPSLIPLSFLSFPPPPSPDARPLSLSSLLSPCLRPLS